MANPSVRKIARAGVSSIVTYQCPECKCNLRAYLDEKLFQAGNPLICPKCAAVAMVDQGGNVRPPLTQEWLDFILLQEWYDFLEARAATVERITSPP
jgi:hypothetical protein